MKIVKLNDVCEIIAGQSPPSKFYNDQGIGLPFFQGKTDFGKLHPSVRMWCSEPKKIAEAGDILISVRAPVGPTNLADQRCCIGRGLSAIRPSKAIDTKFLLQYFKAIEPKISNMGNGSTFSAITQKDLRAIEIPLPPLAEQQRIAAILDKADALRSQRRAALAKLDTLLQSTFLHLFGDPVTNPMEWEVVKAGEVMKDIIAGASYGGEQRELESDELGVLKISAVTTGQFDPTEFKAVKISDIKKDIVKPRKGDLLFSRANTREMVAATCIVDEDYDYLFLPDKLWRIDFDENRCVNWYFKLLLSHEGFRYELTKTATGTSGSMLNISKAKLRSLRMPLPPIELQMEFGKCVGKIENQNKQLKYASEQLDNLFHALQQRAFNGQLSM